VTSPDIVFAEILSVHMKTATRAMTARDAPHQVAFSFRLHALVTFSLIFAPAP
jgi:hypothetical protein